MVEVLVSAAGEVDEDVLFPRALFGFAHGGGEGVGAFEGGDDAFVLAEGLEGVEGFPVGDAFVADALEIVEEGVFGADAGVVEAGGDGPGFVDLSFVGLQQVGEGAVEFPGEPPTREAAWRGVSRPWPAASAPIISHGSSRKG